MTAFTGEPLLERFQPVEHRASHLQRQLKAFGYSVTLDRVEQAQAEPAP